jgi:hypothetical protein
MQPRPTSLRGLRPSPVSLLSCLPLLGALLALGARPAHALVQITSSQTINYSINDGVIVSGTGTVLTIVSGGSISGRVDADAGTVVNVSGGSVGDLKAFGGTINVYSGSAGGGSSAVFYPGTINLHGGTIGGFFFIDPDATLNVYGCNLVLSGSALSQLTGTLQDGTAINISVELRESSRLNLITDCATTLVNVIGRVVSDPAVVQGLLDKLNAIETAPNARARAGAVGAFIAQVNAQTGRSISPANAALLIQLLSAL